VRVPLRSGKKSKPAAGAARPRHRRLRRLMPGGRVEAAFLSGRALAGRLLGADGLIGQDGGLELLVHSARPISAVP
jgi:hypothetical protein